MMKRIKGRQFGLRCDKGDKEVRLFFSLIDYRNNYFTSNRFSDLVEFYNSFSNADMLVEWMRERPRGVPYFSEIPGETEIVVVIPTADINGKFARDCQTDIFPGLQIIFVESATKGDYYFNFAHYVNAGLKKALKHEPNWVVFSSDDMFKIDDVSVLKRELSRFDNKQIDAVFTRASRYHSIPVYFSNQRVTRKLFFSLFKYRRIQLKIEKKYGVKFFSNPSNGYWRIFFKPGYHHLSIADFGIFSAEYIKGKNGEIYDSTYINATEDVDLSLEITKDPRRFAMIDYKIGDFIGSTLGRSVIRHIRDIAGQVYLEYKIKNRLHPTSDEVIGNAP